MSWDAIGAVGELLGALLLVGSLVYVGIQIRETKIQIRASTAQARTDAFIEVWKLRFDPAFAQAEINARQNPENISDLDRHYLVVFLTAFLNHYQNTFYQHQLGMLEAEQAGGLNAMPILSIVPFYRELWKEGTFRKSLNKDFIEHVDEILRRLDA